MRPTFSNLFFVFILSIYCTGCLNPGNKFPENFEEGVKDSYAYGIAELHTGSWALDNALLGKTPKDHKNGKASVRMRGKASLEMKFDVTGEVNQVTIRHALYGRDRASTWQLLYSADGGSTWKPAGQPIVTKSPELKAAVFHVEAREGIRLKIQKTDGQRLNIDDISFNNNEGNTEQPVETAGRDSNLALGNPSNASQKDADNFLIIRPQYALSYNSSRGTANWVSWHLSTAWKGTTERCNCFSPDTGISNTSYNPNSSDYTATGFDRGHLCPSDDRDESLNDNAATFLMTNITPQAPNLNRDNWEKLESYCRGLIADGNELYIIAGAYGIGGYGSKGPANTIAGGKITVPGRFWKVIVVIPVGDDDVHRIDNETRIIAVDMPNTQEVSIYGWKHYRTSVDAIEAATGYDLLSELPVSIQETLESRPDEGPGI